MAECSSRGRRRFKRMANRQQGRSQPTYDTFKFGSESAAQIYDDHLSTKAVVVERHVKFGDARLQNLGLVPEFRRRGWEKFLTQTGQACEDIVREFYANITRIDRQVNGPHIMSKLRGNPFTIGPDDFDSILGLPVVEDTDFRLNHTKYRKDVLVGVMSHNNQPWLGSQYKHVYLRDQFRVLHLVTCSSLIPQKRTSDLSVDRATLMCAIMSKKKVDVRSLIGDVIEKHKNQVKHPGALPFGLFITQVARARGIEMTSDDNMIDPECQIDDSTQDDPDNSESHKSSRPFTMNQVSLSLIRLEGEVAALRVKQDTLSADVQTLTTLCTENFRSLHQKIDDLATYEDEPQGPVDEYTTTGGGSGSAPS